MTAGLRPLRNDRVDAALFEPDGFLDDGREAMTRQPAALMRFRAPGPAGRSES